MEAGLREKIHTFPFFPLISMPEWIKIRGYGMIPGGFIGNTGGSVGSSDMDARFYRGIKPIRGAVPMSDDAGRWTRLADTP
jgi:hypothetical protein